MNPVLEFKSVTLDYGYANPTSDPVVMDFFTQPPGAGPTIVKTENLAKITRATITIDLATAGSLPFGTLWKIRFTVPATATSFRLYGGFAEAREIGVYLVGGQTWETPELGVGQ